MRSENSSLFHSKLLENVLVISLGVNRMHVTIPVKMNSTSMHVLLSAFWQSPGHLAWHLTKCKCICWSHGTPSFWPSFFQEDSILPERTPAVAVIGVFIAQLGHAFSEMQLKQAFQRPILLLKCLYYPCQRQKPSQVPRHTACQDGREINFSRLSSFVVNLSSGKVQ